VIDVNTMAIRALLLSELVAGAYGHGSMSFPRQGIPSMLISCLGPIGVTRNSQSIFLTRINTGQVEVVQLPRMMV